jgi:chromosome segregation protein
LYLKRLDIHGFKTFADKTQIVFTPGITCVIGPNGSGKSNIADAVLWVLGENNVRSLRGSTAQDVIFVGNDRRRPTGMAEVSLTLDNSERLLPLEFSEVTVTRRLYRSGESECFINKVQCRLKDLYQLFLDTGIGRDAYAMVGQGEIDQILSVRSEDRRAIFEEAAGIKKYRVRKREAERKLEHTAQNLLRVNDIIAELETQLGPLQRQAAAARRYRELAARLFALENAWYGARLRRLESERAGLDALRLGLMEERKELEAALQASQGRENTEREVQRGLDAETETARKLEAGAMERLAAVRADSARAEARAEEIQRRLNTLARELDEYAGRIAEQVERQQSTERDEAELRREVDALRAGLTALQGEATVAARAHEAAAAALEQRRQAWVAAARKQAERQARLQSLVGRERSLVESVSRAAEALEDAVGERDRLAAERESHLGAATTQREHAAEHEKELATLREAAKAAESALARARSAADAAAKALQTHNARRQALSELSERGEGAAAGAKRVLEAVRLGRLDGEWSQWIEGLRVPEGLEKAVEAALGFHADALFCATPEQALRATQLLRAGKPATVVMLPGSPHTPAKETEGSLAAVVGAEGAAADWARLLLGGVALAESLEAAVAAAKAAEADGSTLWVTRNGEWVSRAGVVGTGVAGAEGAGAATLARRRELESLATSGKELEQRVAEAREGLGELEAAVRKAQSALRERQTAADRARQEVQLQTREAERRRGDLERATQRVERARVEAARMEREQAQVAASLAELRAAAPEAEVPGEAETDTGVAAAQAEVGKLELARRTAENRVTEARVRLAQQEQRLQGAAAAARRAVEAGAFLDRGRGERLREQRTLTAEAEQGQLAFTTLAQAAAEAEAAAAGAQETQARLTTSRAESNTRLDAARAEAQALGGRLRELMERSHRVSVELTALDSQREQVGRQWLEACERDEESRPSPTPTPPPVETAGEAEAPEPPPLTVAMLLERWDPEAAQTVLAASPDAEAEIARLRRQIRALGAVNPDAVEQYAQSSERFEFLTAQRADLESARTQLETAIAEIDGASRETFLKAFREIAVAFDVMFKKLFGGGNTDLRLTDPNDVLETGIDIIVQPPGKKQQNLLLLSGGERALTAAAMLFALLTVRPSPFCVLDEVDAPLDETNVGRFTQTLREFAGKTQFILVTHNRNTMEQADMLYGVTMQERGVSKLLSCTLDDPVVAQVEAEQHAATAG